MRIWYGFSADEIIFHSPPPDMAIDMGEHLEGLEVNPMPWLNIQERIEYHWEVIEPQGAPPNSGHYQFTSTTNRYQRNSFWADYPGDYELYYRIEDNESTTEAESPHTTVHVNPGLVIDSPAPVDIFWITLEPAMPVITCRAHIEGVPIEEQANLQFNWSGELNYFSEDYSRPWQFSVTGTDDYLLNFGQDFGGGYFLAEVSVEYNGDIYVGNIGLSDVVQVLGENTYSSIVINYINSLTEFTEEVRTCARGAAGVETGDYDQFNRYPVGYPGINEPPGFPYRSDDNGFGIMQLTRLPTPRRIHIFNWHENVYSAREDYIVPKMDSATSYLSWGPDSIPHTPTLEEIRLETYGYYNAGDKKHYFLWDDEIGDGDYVRNYYFNDDCGCHTNRWEHYNGGGQPYPCVPSFCCYADLALTRE